MAIEVHVHVHAKFHQAKCHGSRVIMLTEKNLATIVKTILPSLPWAVIIIINYKFIKLQPFIRFVDVSATTAAFIRMTVHHQ